MSSSVQQRFDQEFRAEIIRQLAEDDLQTNPVYRDFFAQFNSGSVRLFIKAYAHRKALYSVRNDEFQEATSPKAFRYLMLAEEGLWAIQQKKLFNLQCTWRAEQVQYRGIEHSAQFGVFSSHIQHSPYITPVTSTELELYMSFLKSEHVQTGVSSWQDYETCRAEYHAGYTSDVTSENFTPSWYRFYDEHMGTGSLMDLPDIRGLKENRYRSVARQRKLEEMKQQANVNAIDDRPYLSIYDTVLLERFLKRFEDKETLRFFREIEDLYRNAERGIDVDEAIGLLKESKRSVPLKSAGDWKDGIVSAARRIEGEQIANVMPVVFQEYLVRRENGLGHAYSFKDNLQEERAQTTGEMARMQILEGRRILGEPLNFRF
jgi:hypothetical protein